MGFVPILAWIVYSAALIAVYLLWARIVVDVLRAVRPDWRPRGFVLVLFIWVLRLTDPPLRAVRRVIKPIRIGGALLDLGMLVLLIALSIIMAFVGPLRF